MPIEQPLWMSLAETEDGLRVAFIDTAGASHVATVTVSGSTWTWEPSFDLPPIDPMFELHVLEDGGRLLALGVDHRVRLYDARGTMVAELDEHGVIPWQLRVGRDDEGRPVAAVVQFAPVRVQRLSLRNDTLALVGEAHPVEIDQSPNRNDIAMSPDGRYVTAMQKPEPKSGRFEIELIDLHDGSRRMLVGTSDTLWRPRIHPLTDGVLAETGSGRALKLSLEDAVPWTPGSDRAAVEAAPAPSIPMAGSTDDSMMHATMRGGRHAIARGDVLFVQSEDRQVEMERRVRSFAPGAVALDGTGSTVAWATAATIEIDSVQGRSSMPVLGRPPIVLGFGPEDTLVTVDARGAAQIRSRTSGEILDETEVPVAWGVRQHAWRASASGGMVVLADDKPSAPLQVQHIDGTRFGTRETVERSERSRWPEGGKPHRVESSVWMAELGFELGFDLAHSDLHPHRFEPYRPTPPRPLRWWFSLGGSTASTSRSGSGGRSSAARSMAST